MKIIFLILFLFLSVVLFSQEIPNWIRYGLTIEEVKEYLNIRNFMEFEYGYENQLGFGFWTRYGTNELNQFAFSNIEGVNSLAQYITMSSDEIRINRERSGSYTFLFDSQNKLTAFNFLIISNYEDMLNTLSERFGSFKQYKSEEFYETHYFENEYNLPNNVDAILIIRPSIENDFIGVIYNLRIPCETQSVNQLENR